MHLQTLSAIPPSPLDCMCLSRSRTKAAPPARPVTVRTPPHTGGPTAAAVALQVAGDQGMGWSTTRAQVCSCACVCLFMCVCVRTLLCLLSLCMFAGSFVALLLMPLPCPVLCTLPAMHRYRESRAKAITPEPQRAANGVRVMSAARLLAAPRERERERESESERASC